MKNKNEDTIVAQATPYGTSAISIIRISGKNSEQIIRQLTGDKALVPNRVKYKNIKHNKKIIDDIQYVFYKSPKSYTGEDCVEIFCHGNQIIVEKIKELIIENGARVADRGEFTKRAYVNGKLDLLQAESILDIIHGQSEIELEISRKNRVGILTKKVGYLRQIMVEILKKVELEIDFVDQDVEIYAENEIENQLKNIENAVNELLEFHDIYKKIKKGIEICFYGDTNVGKSSLYNLLLNANRSIVNEEPGTTRNLVSENLFFNNRNITIYDTAGVRETSSSVEKEGVERTIKKAIEADIILYVIDASRRETHKSPPFDDVLEKSKTIRIINKIDLVQNIDIADNELFYATICTSAIKNQVKDLETIINRLILEKKEFKNGFSINERQYYCLKETKKYIMNAKNVISTPDLLSYEIKMVAESLEMLIGRVNSEEILNAIFENFCIGK